MFLNLRFRDFLLVTLSTSHQLFFPPTFREKCNDSKTGEESSCSRDISGLSTIPQDALKGAGEEEDHNITERLTPTDKLCEAESLNREVDAEEPGGAAEQNPSGILDPANGKDISHVSREDVDHSDLEFSGISPGVSDGAARVSSPTAAEGGGSDKERGLDRDVVDPNGKTGAEEQAEVLPHYECPDVDAFAANCEEKESTMEGSATTDDRQEGDEDTNLKLETERPEDNQQGADDQAGGTEEMGRSQTCSEEMHERLSDLEGSNTRKGDTLVEVSFEDLPEAQDMKQFEPEEAEVVEGSPTDMEKQPLEESKEVAAAAPHQNVPVTQGGGEHEMVGVEREVNSEEKEMENQQGASVMKERADTNDSGLSDGEDEMGRGDKVVSSSDRPAGTPEKDNPEYEKGHAHESSLKTGEGESQERDPESEGAEMAGLQKGDEEDASKQGRCEAGAETRSPQATRSNSSTGAPETETETVETSTQHLAEEDKGQRTAAEEEPEVTAMEEETPKSSEVVDQFDPVQATFVKDSVHPDPPADEGEKGHLGQDTLGPEDNSGEKVTVARCLNKEYSSHPWQFCLTNRIWTPSDTEGQFYQPVSLRSPINNPV